MDSTAIINALYDTKCLKFGNYLLKSGVKAPYYMNLRRLPLYPNLMSSIETLTVERFLTINKNQNNNKNKDSFQKNGTSPSEAGSIESDRDLSRESSEEDFSSYSELSDKRGSDLSSDSSCDDCDNKQQANLIGDDLDPIICGVPYGAIALAKGIADKARLPLLFERKEDKSYGDKQCLMDDFNQETRSASHENQPASKVDSQNCRQRVILIEDVICSGESILDTAQSLARRNLKVEFVICIVNREEGGVRLLLEKANIKVFPLFDMSDILSTLRESGRLSDVQYDSISNWMSNNQFESINGYPKDISDEKLKSFLKAD